MRSALVIAAALLAVSCASDLLVLDPHGDALDPDAMSGLDSGQPPLDASGDGQAPTPDGNGPLPAPGRRLVSAFSHTCALSEGALFCWGPGAADRQIGGVDAPIALPLRIAEGDFSDVCAGEEHSCVLQTDGTVLCWGQNAHGQLGLGDFDPRDRPTAIPSSRFLSLACGGATTCAIAPPGELFCWGANWEGQLGQNDAGEPHDSNVPLRVASELSFHRVSVAQGHVCAITERGALYCWGRNTTGQLGLGTPIIQLRVPTQIGAGPYAQIATGLFHSCAIARDGRLFCWGNNNEQVLGLGAEVGRMDVPTQVGSDSDYQDLQANWFHNCARKQNGALVCWGRNVEGQLGLGDTVSRSTPTQIGETGWSTSIALGAFHTCAFRAQDLFCWGKNEEGQLGLEGGQARERPSAVPLP